MVLVLKLGLKAQGACFRAFEYMSRGDYYCQKSTHRGRKWPCFVATCNLNVLVLIGRSLR